MPEQQLPSGITLHVEDEGSPGPPIEFIQGLFGKDPKLTNPAVGDYIAAQIQGARFRAFPESSHCPFWEEGDAFNGAVADFAADLW
jgi:pimeloyl-ACP methyl ester carboxylesterase